MVMRKYDVGRRQRLLRAWDYTCIVCGHGFDDIASVTIEHLVPRSMGGGAGDNLAPSHHNCNKLRSSMSLCKAARLLARKRKRMGDALFFLWINVKVPHRVIPHGVWVPVRPLACLEPPEFLPGVSR